MSEQEVKSSKDFEITSVDVADIPYASADSHPPIIVDLPDGQKLVVGKLEAGTVIEVATWRGTGRPDSRTNRLMIGVSGNDAPTSEKQEEKRKIFAKKNELDAPSAPADNESVVTPPSGKSLPSKIRNWSIALVILGLLIGIAGGPLHLRMVHPRSGVGTSLGSAGSSVVVVQKSKTYKAGEKVIAGIADTKRSPLLGAIQVIDQGHVLVTTGPQYYSSETPKISGKVILVLPFFGWIVGLFA